MENSCDNKCDPIKHFIKNNQVSSIHPVVLGSPETTVSVDTESTNSICEDWEEELAVQNNAAVSQGANINVENSNDVVIGPLTQFHGPVTIFQNINSDNQTAPKKNGIEFKSDINLNIPAKPGPTDNISSEKQHSVSKLISASSYMHYVICSILVTAMLTVIIFGVVITLNIYSNSNTTDKERDDYQTTTATNNFTTYPDIGNHKIYYKEQWKGKPPLGFIKSLNHPTEYVVISHTAGSTCDNVMQCSSMVQSIQEYHINEKEELDIGYNFLIGGDGNIYIGRGWDFVNYVKDNNIDISFIGNYNDYKLTPIMISALKKLLDLAVTLNKIPSNYKLVCHYQVAATQSPGKNAIKEISKFPNYYDGPITI